MSQQLATNLNSLYCHLAAEWVTTERGAVLAGFNLKHHVIIC